MSRCYPARAKNGVRWVSGRAFGPSRGTSMFEMLVATFLLGLIMMTIHTILMYGINYYRTQSATIDVQQSALIAMSALTNELVESNPGSMLTDMNPPTIGIVFGSPRDQTGQVNYSDTKLQWSKFVCYYLDVINDVPCLMRTERPLTDFPGTGNGAFPPPISTAWDAEYFRSTAGNRARIVARNISRLESTQSFPLPILIEASVYDRYQFKVELETKVTPKN